MTMDRFWRGVGFLVRVDMAVFIAGTAALLFWVNWH
jgi:hypothetical protein